MVTEVCPNCRSHTGSAMENCNSTNASHNYRFPEVTCPCHKLQAIPVQGYNTRHSRPHQFFDSGPKTAFRLFLWIFIIIPLSTMANPLPLEDQQAVPSSSSSSGHHKSSRRPHDRPAKWINPCRIPSALPAFTMDMDIEIITQPDSEIIENIITQVNKALHQSKAFMPHYYNKMFGEDLKVRDKFADVHYDFLKDINEKVKKRLGEDLSREDLEEQKLAETLRFMYTGLQSYAVGLEQIVLDQSVYAGSFHKEFQEAEYQLKYVLCELQIALLEKGIQHEDVTREVMNSDYRDIDCDTIRNIRDWVIFRDYVNTLEFIQQSFKWFLENLETR